MSRFTAQLTNRPIGGDNEPRVGRPTRLITPVVVVVGLVGRGPSGVVIGGKGSDRRDSRSQQQWHGVSASMVLTSFFLEKEPKEVVNREFAGLHHEGRGECSIGGVQPTKNVADEIFVGDRSEIFGKGISNRPFLVDIFNHGESTFGETLQLGLEVHPTSPGLRLEAAFNGGPRSMSRGGTDDRREGTLSQGGAQP
ncbi:hypothetical protein LINGRAHAP2_LOCUS1928 [Linum grandiflorum]